MELTSEAAADPVFEGAPSSFPALQWHADTFDLPHGATRLGPGTLDRLVDEVAAKENETIPLGRRLFGRRLERVARVPAATIG